MYMESHNYFIKLACFAAKQNWTLHVHGDITVINRLDNYKYSLMK